jgi:hypothetical protein
MTQPIRRLEVLPFRGPEEGERILARERGHLTLHDFPAVWNVIAILTDRRLVFEGATWQVPLSDIEALRVPLRRSWWLELAGNVIVGLIPFVGAGLAGLPNTDVWMQLRDGRTLTLRFDRRRKAVRFAAGVTAHIRRRDRPGGRGSQPPERPQISNPGRGAHGGNRPFPP